MTQAVARIVSTYAYHPANNNPDLVIPTEAVEHYNYERPGPLRGNFSPLRHSLATEGVLSPLVIATDGQWGTLRDGNHRLRLAKELGIVELPVQIVPDNMRRISMKFGRAVLENHVLSWIPENLWVHTTHEIIRRRVSVGRLGKWEQPRLARAGRGQQKSGSGRRWTEPASAGCGLAAVTTKGMGVSGMASARSIPIDLPMSCLLDRYPMGTTLITVTHAPSVVSTLAI
jgi:ParB-like nuclease domain